MSETTPNIPEAAVEAAMATMHEHSRTDVYMSRSERAREILAAALPHLGEHGVEYAGQTTNPETGQRTEPVLYCDRDYAKAMLAGVKPEWKPQLLQRTTIYGEWTEVET